MIIRKASVDFCIMDAGGIKGQRTRQLLNELVNKELLACIGTTKRRRYIKPVD